MNLTKMLKSAPLPSGFYAICGEQGAGKTSLATALFKEDYRRHRKKRKELALDLARRFFADSGIRLEISDTLYFSNNRIILDKRRGVETWEVDLQRLGLPNDGFEVQYLPRGSAVFIQEADILAFCRDWESLNNYLINLIKFIRHNLITLIFDMQVGGALDKALRRLLVGMYYVVKSGVGRFLIFWKRQKWKFLYIRNQLNAVVKELSTLGVNIKIKVAEWGKFRIWGDVFDRYNSFSGEPYFLYGIEKVGYVYKRHTDGDYSVDGIKAYCKAHPLERPEEVKKQQPKPKSSERTSTFNSFKKYGYGKGPSRS